MGKKICDQPTRLAWVARVLAILGCVAAGATHADQIDDYIRVQLQRQHIPGLSLAIVQDGRVLKRQGYGFADLELEVPATPATVFEIGSISKQFLSAAVMTLVEEGRLGLGDPIAKFLPDLSPAWKEVTVRQLLTHTSGIPDFEEILGYGAYRNPTTAEQLLSVAAGKPVFHIEYVDDWADAEARAAEVCGVGPDLDTLIKTWELGAERLACE